MSKIKNHIYLKKRGGGGGGGMPRPRNQKIKRRGNVAQEKKQKYKATLLPGEKEKKIKATWRSPYACAHEHFCQSRKNSSPLNFLCPFWGVNILVGSGRKHMDPTNYFPSFLPN